MPGWAIGPWCADLDQAAGDHKQPDRLCWAADDLLILAPWRADNDHWAGFVICERSALGQRRVCWSEEGESVELRVPSRLGSGGGNTAYIIAQAAVRLQITNRLATAEPATGPENSGQLHKT